MARKTGSHGDITGPKVRAAALKLFARQGYAAVSMRQIAAEVGVQAGALYLYITDKQSLLAELMLTHLEELLAAWEEVEAGEAPLERLEAFTRFHIRHHLARPDDVFIAYMELRSLEPENFARVEALRRRYEQVLQDILEAGAEVFKLADPRLTTMAIIAMLTGVSTWYREGGRLSRAEVEQNYWELVRRAVGC